jgi:hypothetical protein
MEGQVSTPNGSSCKREVSFPAPEPGLPELWDSYPFDSFPMDPCKSIPFADPSAYLL